MNYLALARKARLVEVGEEPVGAVTRACKAALVIVASDASDHSWRRAKSYVAGTDQPCLRLKQTKEEMGLAVGRTSLAMAALTDPSLALAMVQSMDAPDAAVLKVLEQKAQRQQNRRREAKAHQRNVRKGKKK
jgi:ribosomal protein L7Ae-like RNA K-turn-binding protein